MNFNIDYFMSIVILVNFLTSVIISFLTARLKFTVEFIFELRTYVYPVVRIIVRQGTALGSMKTS